MIFSSGMKFKTHKMRLPFPVDVLLSYIRPYESRSISWNLQTSDGHGTSKLHKTVKSTLKRKNDKEHLSKGLLQSGESGKTSLVKR